MVPQLLHFFITTNLCHIHQNALVFECEILDSIGRIEILSSFVNNQMPDFGFSRTLQTKQQNTHRFSKKIWMLSFGFVHRFDYLQRRCISTATT